MTNATAPAREDETPRYLGHNARQLRAARGLSQQQLAALSGIPRATIANVESGGANPTLSVLTGLARALRVSIEELLSPPRAFGRLYAAEELKQRRRGEVEIRNLLPDPLPGLQIERMGFPPGARFAGTPHTPGTREYLTCESGRLELSVGGEVYTLSPGDVVVFRGDQRHGYRSAGEGPAVGYSVVVLAPVSL